MSLEYTRIYMSKVKETSYNKIVGHVTKPKRLFLYEFQSSSSPNNPHYGHFLYPSPSSYLSLSEFSTTPRLFQSQLRRPLLPVSTRLYRSEIVRVVRVSNRPPTDPSHTRIVLVLALRTSTTSTFDTLLTWGCRLVFQENTFLRFTPWRYRRGQMGNIVHLSEEVCINPSRREGHFLNLLALITLLYVGGNDVNKNLHVVHE